MDAPCCFSFFFFNDTATTEIYTLSLHDALPISEHVPQAGGVGAALPFGHGVQRSEEHTSELQSPMYLVCRLLLEKKNKKRQRPHTHKKTTENYTNTHIVRQT